MLFTVQEKDSLGHVLLFDHVYYYLRLLSLELCELEKIHIYLKLLGEC